MANTRSKKLVKRYNHYWPRDMSAIAIELYAYVTEGIQGTTGKTAEEHFRNAFMLAWPNFRWHEWVDLQIWAWCNFKVTNVIGHTRASKTYTLGHIVYLDYVAEPYSTWTSIATVTFGGLKDRMWGDVMTAIGTASFDCPFRIISNTNEAKLKHNWDTSINDAENRSRERFQIDGFAVANTKDAKGRIQGKHCPRRRVVLDEAQEVEEKCEDIYVAEKNAMSAPDYKGARLANPVDQLSKFGGKCEPTNGWGSVSVDDKYWRTKDNNICLHLDGFKCKNMTIFNSLERGDITKEEYDRELLPFQPRAEYFLGLEEGTLEYWMYGRGYFPPDGVVSRVFSVSHLDRGKGWFEYDNLTTKIGMLDPAYEHDDCVLILAEYGPDRNGDTIVRFMESHKIVANMKINGEGKSKDYLLAESIKDKCVKFGVTPENFIMDKTGNGRSIWSLLSMKSLWGPEIHGCEFGGKPTERPLKSGDSDKCENLFHYFVDELWFRAAEWFIEGQVYNYEKLDENAAKDLGSRRYGIRSNKRRIETKDELKKRLGRSPDYGDALILFAELLAIKGIYPGKGGVTGDGLEILKTINETQLELAQKASSIYNEDEMFSNNEL